MPALFAEGLDNYDVEHPFHENPIITRPTLGEIEAGWKPMNAAHLEGEAEALEERRSMEAHYRHRAREQMSYWRR